MYCSNFKKQDEKQISAAEDSSDIETKIDEGVDAYTLMLAEFVPGGDLEKHTIAQGGNSRKVNYKHQWSKSKTFKFSTLMPSNIMSYFCTRSYTFELHF